jgi:predicted dehydrogenase
VPNDAHYTVCRDAIEARIPVCVEKPLATTLAGAHHLDRVAQRAGVPLYTAFHRRHNDNLRSLLSKMDGIRPVSVEVRYLERIEEHVGTDAWYLDPDRCGGGCVADNGPNAFDLVRRLLGEVVVKSVSVSRDAAGVDRDAVVALETPDGATALVELDWSFPGEIKDVQVELADGRTLRADLLDGYPEFKGSLWHEYRGVLTEFTGLVATGRSVPADGLAALALVDSCYRIEQKAGTP